MPGKECGFCAKELRTEIEVFHHNCSEDINSLTNWSAKELQECLGEIHRRLDSIEATIKLYREKYEGNL